MGQDPFPDFFHKVPTSSICVFLQTYRQTDSHEHLLGRGNDFDFLVEMTTKVMNRSSRNFVGCRARPEEEVVAYGGKHNYILDMIKSYFLEIAPLGVFVLFIHILIIRLYF